MYPLCWCIKIFRHCIFEKHIGLLIVNKNFLFHGANCVNSFFWCSFYRKKRVNTNSPHETLYLIRLFFFITFTVYQLAYFLPYHVREFRCLFLLITKQVSRVWILVGLHYGLILFLWFGRAT